MANRRDVIPFPPARACHTPRAPKRHAVAGQGPPSTGKRARVAARRPAAQTPSSKLVPPTRRISSIFAGVLAITPGGRNGLRRQAEETAGSCGSRWRGRDRGGTKTTRRRTSAPRVPVFRAGGAEPLSDLESVWCPGAHGSRAKVSLPDSPIGERSDWIRTVGAALLCSETTLNKKSKYFPTMLIENPSYPVTACLPSSTRAPHARRKRRGLSV